MSGFDWTFGLRDMITAASAVLVVGGLLYKRGRADRSLEAQDDVLETKLETAVLMSARETTALKDEMSAVREELKQLATIMSKVAVQETKIDLLMKWYDELRRGIGVITSPDKTS